MAVEQTTFVQQTIIALYPLPQEMNKKAWEVVKEFRDSNFPTWYGKAGSKSLEEVPVLQETWAQKMSSPPITTRRVIRRTYANVCVQTVNACDKHERERERERQRERERERERGTSERDRIERQTKSERGKETEREATWQRIEIGRRDE